MLIRRSLDFGSGDAKARFIDFWGRLEAHSAPIRDLVARRGWATLAPIPRAEAIHGYARDAIRYQRDPNHREELGDAGTVSGRGYDDCDGKARLFVACARAAGLDARIRPVFQSGVFTHVQAEVFLPEHPRAMADGWVLAELILRGVPLGCGAEAARRDARGRYIYT